MPFSPSLLHSAGSLPRTLVFLRLEGDDKVKGEGMEMEIVQPIGRLRGVIVRTSGKEREGVASCCSAKGGEE